MDTDTTSSTISTASVRAMVDKLKNYKRCNSTNKLYLSVWRSFNEFFIRLDSKPRSWEERLVLFVGYLVNKKTRSSTVASYISVIKAVLRDDGVILNEDKYLLSVLTKASRVINDKVKTRLPINKGVLSLIIKSIDDMFYNQPYLDRMYKALFITAYFGLFRIGKLTAGTHPVKALDVHIGENKNKMMFVLRSSKTHNKSDHPQIIKLTQENATSPTVSHALHIHSKQLCPFQALCNYMQVWKRSCYQVQEPFFVFKDRSPVKLVHMRAVLRRALDGAGLNHEFYGVHSLHIGRASDMLKMGIELSIIRIFCH